MGPLPEAVWDPHQNSNSQPLTGPRYHGLKAQHKLAQSFELLEVPVYISEKCTALMPGSNNEPELTKTQVLQNLQKQRELHHTSATCYNGPRGTVQFWIKRLSKSRWPNAENLSNWPPVERDLIRPKTLSQCQDHQWNFWEKTCMAQASRN